MNVAKTQAAVNKKNIPESGPTNDKLYEVELAKSEIEQKEPLIVLFFI